MLTTEQFTYSLRDALDHLYDPERVRHNPLAALLGVAGRANTPFVLRQMLTDQIESLKPQPDVSPDAPVWRAYEILVFRYVQQFSQKEVADQLGLSVRQLRREQEAALGLLVSQVCTDLDLGGKLTAGGSRSEDLPAAPLPDSVAANDELTWLRHSSPGHSASVAQVLSTVLRLVRPLAGQVGMSLEADLPDDALPDLAAHPLALQQALLSVLTVAMHRAPGGRVAVSAKPVCWEVEITVMASHPRPGPVHPHGDDASNLDMARRLVDMCGGSLGFPDGPEAFVSRLVLPALEQLPVLAIDDKEDALQLLKRYASGTRYRIIGIRNAEEALTMAEKTSPRIIVLDVMMPGVDGWELLGRLRQHPLTSHIPIIVWTILAQEELALSLGASDFLCKPATRQMVLDALDRQALAAKESH